MTICMHHHFHAVFVNKKNSFTNLDNTSLKCTDYSSSLRSFGTEKRSVGSSLLEFKLGKYSIICQATYVQREKHRPSEEKKENYFSVNNQNYNQRSADITEKEEKSPSWFCCQNRLRKHRVICRSQIRPTFGRKDKRLGDLVTTVMESAVREICGRYSRKIKVPIDENLIRCFSALYEVSCCYSCFSFAIIKFLREPKYQELN